MKQKFKLTILVITVLFLAACKIGGDPSFSPDPTVEQLFDDGEAGDSANGAAASQDDEENAEQENAKDCFEEGFCYLECEVSNDCPEGFSCIMNVCTFDCQSDAECGIGGVCNSMGLCEVSDGEVIPPCTSNEDCGEGRFCNDAGECEQIPTLLGCQSDADCLADQFCDDLHNCDTLPETGVECLSDADCLGDFFCDAMGECTQECRTDFECSEGEACDGLGRCLVAGIPVKLISFSFGALGSTSDPLGSTTFGSTKFKLSNVQITPAGRNLVLSSPNFRLTGSFSY